jgi:group I intron endonuclease
MGKVSCIYCIVHKLDKDMENIYIGSTKDLRHRRWNHKSNCNNEKKETYNSKVYQYIRDNGGIDNFEFIILEECQVEKLKRMEQSYMDVYKPSLNSQYADGRDIQRYKEHKKEWREQNKEHMKELCKEWREQNKEHRLEYLKNYHERNKEYIYEKFNCECGGKFTRGNKGQHEKTKRHQRYLENNNISTV